VHTGPQFTSTQPTAPGGGGGRGTPLLIGGIAFAVVFLLIVGGTIGYLVLRGGGDPTSGEDTPTTPASESASEDGSATPTEQVEEQRCWSPDSMERSSSNPSGKLRGGGLQFIPPAIYDVRQSPRGVAFMNDTQGAFAQVEDGWHSGLAVGAVEWQPGIEYPGAEVASQRIVSCYFSASIWGDTEGRSLDDQVTEPVTIAGLPGYRTSATVNFAKIDLEKTSATHLSVIVLDTPQGPSAFLEETAIGVTEHEEGAAAALESLTGVS
jgi:hypothetical protein